MRQIIYLFRQFFLLLRKQQQEGIEQGYAPTLLVTTKQEKS